MEHPLDAYAYRTIRRYAGRLIGRYGYRLQDLPDIEGDLALYLLEQLPRYDPNRGSRATFINHLIEHRISDLVSARQRACRNLGEHLLSLAEALEDDPQATLEDIATDDAVQRQRGFRTADDISACDDRIDLERALAALSPELRSLCLALMQHSISEIARSTGIPRGTLYLRRDRIRACFQRYGIQERLR